MGWFRKAFKQFNSLLVAQMSDQDLSLLLSVIHRLYEID